MKKAVCFYHSRDLDGWASAAIVQKAHPHVKLVGWDYGDPIPQQDIDEADNIIIVDICFPPDVMNEIHFSGKGFIWCDHHESIKDAKKHPFGAAFGKREINFGACELTWFEFFPKNPIPLPIEFLGAYDCFRHKSQPEWYQDKVLYFQWAARAFINDPEGVKDMILVDSFSDMDLWLTYGFAIRAYLNMEALGFYKNTFPVNWHGHSMLFINRERFNPVNFGIDYHKDGFDVFGCFWLKEGKWHFSLYNDNGKVNVADICKAEGGGGHAGAAGFVKNIEWITELSRYTTGGDGGAKK